MRAARNFKRMCWAMLALLVCFAFYRYYDPMPDIEMPVRNLPNPNGYDALVEAARRVELNDNIHYRDESSRKITHNELVNSRRLVNANIAFCEQAVRALDMPFVAPLPTSAEDHYRLQNDIETVGTILAAQAFFYIRDKRFQQAYEAAFKGWRIGARWSETGPINTGQAVGEKIRKAARTEIYNLSEIEPPNNPQVYIHSIEEAFDRTPDFRSMLPRELEDFKSAWLHQMRNGSQNRESNGLERGVFGSYEYDGWEAVQMSLLKKRQMMDAGFQMRKEAAERLPKYYTSADIDLTYQGVATTFSWNIYNLQTTRWEFELCRCMDSMVLVWLGLEEYKRQYGVYPDTLAQLSPKILKNQPTDPFGMGQALRYRKTKKSFLLYSVGPDGIDGGGRPAYSSSSTVSVYTDEIYPSTPDDIVWGVNKI